MLFLKKRQPHINMFKYGIITAGNLILRLTETNTAAFNVSIVKFYYLLKQTTNTAF
jgi:hypothetical protein